MSFVSPLYAERNFELDLDRPAAERRQVEHLRRKARINDLDNHNVRRVRELQVEVVKLRDVRGINPDVVLAANPLTEASALHALAADFQRSLGQDPFGQVEALEGVLP